MTTTDTDLYEALKAGEATVTFTKVDGTTRVMRCTQNFEDIPLLKIPQQEALPTAQNPNVARVFDLDLQEWRSFRKDSVSVWF